MVTLSDGPLQMASSSSAARLSKVTATAAVVDKDGPHRGAEGQCSQLDEAETVQQQQQPLKQPQQTRLQHCSPTPPSGTVKFVLGQTLQSVLADYHQRSQAAMEARMRTGSAGEEASPATAIPYLSTYDLLLTQDKHKRTTQRWLDGLLKYDEVTKVVSRRQGCTDTKGPLISPARRRWPLMTRAS